MHIISKYKNPHNSILSRQKYKGPSAELSKRNFKPVSVFIELKLQNITWGISHNASEIQKGSPLLRNPENGCEG